MGICGRIEDETGGWIWRRGGRVRIPSSPACFPASLTGLAGKFQRKPAEVGGQDNRMSEEGGSRRRSVRSAGDGAERVGGCSRWSVSYRVGVGEMGRLE